MYIILIPHSIVNFISTGKRIHTCKVIVQPILPTDDNVRNRQFRNSGRNFEIQLS